MKEIKTKIIDQLSSLIQEKINAIQQSISLAEESRNDATKSSVGDKHETSRALVQNEIENYQNLLNKALLQQNQLNNIPLEISNKTIQLGSLVSTSDGIFFIGLGWGKISIDKVIYFCVSGASPIGKLLLGKEKNSTFSFSNRLITIKSIH